MELLSYDELTSIAKFLSAADRWSFAATTNKTRQKFKGQDKQNLFERFTAKYAGEFVLRYDSDWYITKPYLDTIAHVKLNDFVRPRVKNLRARPDMVTLRKCKERQIEKFFRALNVVSPKHVIQRLRVDGLLAPLDQIAELCPEVAVRMVEFFVVDDVTPTDPHETVESLSFFGQGANIQTLNLSQFCSARQGNIHVLVISCLDLLGYENFNKVSISEIQFNSFGANFSTFVGQVWPRNLKKLVWNSFSPVTLPNTVETVDTCVEMVAGISNVQHVTKLLLDGCFGATATNVGNISQWTSLTCLRFRLVASWDFDAGLLLELLGLCRPRPSITSLSVAAVYVEGDFDAFLRAVAEVFPSVSELHLSYRLEDCADGFALGMFTALERVFLDIVAEFEVDREYLIDNDVVHLVDACGVRVVDVQVSKDHSFPVVVNAPHAEAVCVRGPFSTNCVVNTGRLKHLMKDNIFDQ